MRSITVHVVWVHLGELRGRTISDNTVSGRGAETAWEGAWGKFGDGGNILPSDKGFECMNFVPTNATGTLNVLCILVYESYIISKKSI